MQHRPDQPPNDPRARRASAPGPRPAAERYLEPAWRRVTEGEHRLAVTLAIALAIGLQLSLPQRLAFRPVWLLPALEAAVLLALVAANPGRMRRRTPLVRYASLVLIVIMSVANGFSAFRLADGLLHKSGESNATSLLLNAAAVWLTNVIAFALWYWELDRGGPGARAEATRQHPDFLFPQMQSPDIAPPDWEPEFTDYLYVSFTNATAFSPTDTLPLTRWAKLAMLLQSAISLVTVALVIARAVNILQ